MRRLGTICVGLALCALSTRSVYSQTSITNVSPSAAATGDTVTMSGRGFLRGARVDPEDVTLWVTQPNGTGVPRRVESLTVVRRVTAHCSHDHNFV
ncbi:MAG: hypothetical protein AAF517_28385, partial [Planctomycetota bacterium]